MTNDVDSGVPQRKALTLTSNAASVGAGGFKGDLYMNARRIFDKNDPEDWKNIAVPLVQFLVATREEIFLHGKEITRISTKLNKVEKK